jgi:hypothetical protein
MSSNRLRYDKCAYAIDIKESTSQLDYNIFLNKYENNSNCPVKDFTSNLDFTSRAVIESELHGITRPATQCPSLKYSANNNFQPASFSPARMCENIYYITPNNLVKPKTTMVNNQD